MSEECKHYKTLKALKRKDDLTKVRHIDNEKIEPSYVLFQKLFKGELKELIRKGKANMVTRNTEK